MNQEVEQERATTSSSTVPEGHVGWGRGGEAYDEQFLALTERSGMQSASTSGSADADADAGLGSPGNGGKGGAPCGACKFLRRKCVKGCIFAPYFGAEQGAARFAAVHKIFGASNVSKLLQRIPAQKRVDAVITICYEAQARIANPVYGCVATIAELQQQVLSLQAELSLVQAQLASSRELAAVSMAMQQQQPQHHHAHVLSPAALFAPYDPTVLNPVHMQQFVPPSMPIPGTLGAYATVKEETENRFDEGIPAYDISIATTPTTTLAASHMQQQSHHDQQPHLHHDHHIEAAQDVLHVPQTDPTQLHALLRTRCFDPTEAS